ncbi:MAG: DUF2946 family protein [Phycisphaerae bacterium]
MARLLGYWKYNGGHFTAKNTSFGDSGTSMSSVRHFVACFTAFAVLSVTGGLAGALHQMSAVPSQSSGHVLDVSSSGGCSHHHHHDHDHHDESEQKPGDPHHHDGDCSICSLIATGTNALTIDLDEPPCFIESVELTNLPTESQLVSSLVDASGPARAPPSIV